MLQLKLVSLEEENSSGIASPQSVIEHKSFSEEEAAKALLMLHFARVNKKMIRDLMLKIAFYVDRNKKYSKEFHMLLLQVKSALRSR